MWPAAHKFSDDLDEKNFRIAAIGLPFMPSFEGSRSSGHFEVPLTDAALCGLQFGLHLVLLSVNMPSYGAQAFLVETAPIVADRDA